MKEQVTLVAMRAIAVLALAHLAAGGCATATENPDAGAAPDAGPMVDAPASPRADARRLPDATPGAPDATPLADAMPGAPDATPLADAMPGPPDAALPPDAAVPRPDAAPGTPDAAPPPDAALPPDACVPTTMQLLANPAFESGRTGWIEDSGGGFDLIVQEGAGLPDGFLAHTSPWAAWLGGYTLGSDDLYQSFTVPASATAITVTGQRLIGTEEIGAWDTIDIDLRSPSGGLLETLALWDSSMGDSAWTSFTLTPGSAYAGQVVTLRFHIETDFSNNTNLFLDSLALTVTACP